MVVGIALPYRRLCARTSSQATTGGALILPIFRRAASTIHPLLRIVLFDGVPERAEQGHPGRLEAVGLASLPDWATELPIWLNHPHLEQVVRRTGFSARHPCSAGRAGPGKWPRISHADTEPAARQPSLTDDEEQFRSIAGGGERVAIPIANRSAHIFDGLPVLGYQPGPESVAIFSLNIHVSGVAEHGRNGLLLFALRKQQCRNEQQDARCQGADSHTCPRFVEVIHPRHRAEWTRIRWLDRFRGLR